AGTPPLQLGKRYKSPDGAVEILVNKPGPCDLRYEGQPMELKEAKPLPSSASLGSPFRVPRFAFRVGIVSRDETSVSSTPAPVLYELLDDGQLAVVTLNRPQRLNASHKTR